MFSGTEERFEDLKMGKTRLSRIFEGQEMLNICFPLKVAITASSIKSSDNCVLAVGHLGQWIKLVLIRLHK